MQTPTRKMQIMNQLLNEKMTPNEQRMMNSQTPPSHIIPNLSPSPATVNQHLLQPCEPAQHQEMVRQQMEYLVPHAAPQLQQMHYLFP